MNSRLVTIKLSGDKGTPVYQQIKDAIRAKPKSGEWLAGEMIPSANQLADSLNSSRITSTRSLSETTPQGLQNTVNA